MVSPTLQHVPAAEKQVKRDRRAIYGRIDRMRIGKSLRIRRLTEVIACKHWLNTGDPEFEPIPPRPERYAINCYVCEEYKMPEEFHRDAANTWRLGRYKVCKECRKEGKTSAPNKWNRDVFEACPLKA